MLLGKEQVRHDCEVRMAENDNRSGRPGVPKSQGGTPKAPGGRTSSDASFDRWLVDQMRKLYDQVLEENVPEDLINIVRSFDAEGGSKNEAGSPQSDQPRERRSARES